jgi:tetratricopeptide (TPR) repeat protein
VSFASRLIASAAVAAALAVGSGCANKSARPATDKPVVATTAPSTRPLAEKQTWPLSRVNLQLLGDPLQRPSTQPATQPAPTDALVLFAQGHALLGDNRRVAAADVLERAAKLDPSSADIQQELALAYAGTDQNRALAALRRAAELDPDRLDVLYDLGRVYASRNELDAALPYLLRAKASDEYKDDEVTAAAVDLLLGRALAAKEYDAAAIETLEPLAARTARASFAYRRRPELAPILNEPVRLTVELARLNERIGRYDKAIELLRDVEEDRPDDQGVAAQLVRLNASAGRSKDAADGAVAIVRRQGGSTASVELLQDVGRRLNDADFADRTLRGLLKESPDDRLLRRALVRLLDRENKSAERLALLEQWAGEGRVDASLVSDLIEEHRAAGRTDRAASALVASIARGALPTDTGIALAQRLLDNRAPKALDDATLNALKVPADQEAARRFLLAIYYLSRGRPVATMDAAVAATQAKPALLAAYRSAATAINNRADLTDAEKAGQLDALAARAKASEKPWIADDLAAQTLIRDGRQREAAERFDAVAASSGGAPDVQLARAFAWRNVGETARFEAILGGVLTSNPDFEPAYEALFGHYLEARNAQAALGILGRWRDAIPDSVDAKVRQANVLSQARQPDQLEELLKDLVRERPDDDNVLEAAVLLLNRVGRGAAAVELLRSLVKDDPQNLAAAMVLAQAQQQAGDRAGAVATLGAARNAVADNADRLYILSNGYQLIDRKDIAEEVMEQALKVDPKNASAANDLGYNWSDEGRNLAKAEALVRVAVEAEPDNAAFLDSLGWVLYKNGKFAEAREYLERAVKLSPTQDPTLHDHLGDALWRLNQREAALAAWKQAQQRLANARRDRDAELKRLVDEKVRQAESGADVKVAPLATATPTTQPK